MSRGLSPGKGTQAERLKAAFERTQVDRRVIARIMRGGKPTSAQINYTKSQIVKWLGGAGISDDNAQALAAAFNKATGSILYDPDWFKKPVGPKTWAEAMKENAKLREENERLRKRLRETG